MPSDLARQAYARLKNDRAGRVPYVHPYDLLFIEVDPDPWLDTLEQQVADGAYVANPSPPFETPKPDWHTRPNLALTLADQFVYHYLALETLPLIGPMLDWSDYTVRFSYRVNREGNHWFKHEYQGWRNFDRVSLGKLYGEYDRVLVTDIAGYYENIDIGRLVQELQAAQVEPRVAKQLSALWNKWASPRGRGIPQGYSPSHVFGELYLDPIDRSLSSEEWVHLRYMDDIRIFGHTEDDVRLALHELSRLLRDRSLNLQTAKTDRLSADQGRDRFAMVHRSVRRVGFRLARELVALGNGTDYVPIDEISQLLRADPDAPPVAVVERAWEEYLAGEFGESFNKTLCHYLLARLAEIGSTVAVDYVLDLIVARPEETEHCLKYLGKVREELDRSDVDRLASLLTDDRLLLDYQRYAILGWYWTERLRNDQVLEVARRWTSLVSPPLLRPVAQAYLGDHGEDRPDFERVGRLLQQETGSLARATALYALRRAPAPIRNLWYGRCAEESDMVDRAIACARRDGE